ncbi:MAG: FHA domain-containing protein [Gemmataceae bacterium]
MRPLESEKQFLAACGAAGPITLTVVGPTESARRTVSVPVPFALVGSDPRCDVVLEDQSVSLRHVYLQILGGTLFAIDLGSRTSMYLGLTRYAATWVRPREFLRVGPYHLRCDIPPAPKPPEAVEPPPNPLGDRNPDHSTVPRLSADITVNGRLMSHWRFNRPLALAGRSPSARLKLADPSVSNYHCALVGVPTGVWVVDLRSREGTMINGRTYPFGEVRAGDCLDIGVYRASFRASASSIGSVVRMATPVGRPKRPTALDLSGAPLPVQTEAHPGEELMKKPVLSPIPIAAPMQPEGSGQMLPLLQQFGMMQQQMMDQFQQTLLMMMQMVQKMHSDQIDLIRHEMEQLRQVTIELNEAREARDAAGRANVGRPAAPRPATPPPAPAQRSNRKAKRSGKPKGPRTPALHAPAPPPPAGTPADADVHGQLADRISELEQRRQSLWQRIMGKLSGG